MSVVTPLPAAGKPRRPFRRVRLAMSLPEKALYSFGIRSTKALCLPDFLIIGAAKAGTTWLAENLDAHPQIFMGKRPGCRDPSEMRYFSQGFGKPLKHYSDYFRPGQDKIKGDKSPTYSTISLSRIRFIRRLLPSVRLILFMRNPIERAWSHAVMNLVKFKGRDVAEVPPSLFYDQFARQQEQGPYTTILDRWLSVFPEEQIYTGVYDDIASDPLRVLREVCEHIGADTNVDWSRFPYRRVVNEGKRAPDARRVPPIPGRDVSRRDRANRRAAGRASLPVADRCGGGARDPGHRPQSRALGRAGSRGAGRLGSIRGRLNPQAVPASNSPGLHRPAVASAPRRHSA